MTTPQILFALVGAYFLAWSAVAAVLIARDKWHTRHTLAATLARDPRVRSMPLTESCEWLETAREIDALEVRR